MNAKSNVFTLLIKTLEVINKKNKISFIILILFLILQSILDVITIYSIVPLLYLLEGKETISANISKFLIDLKIENLIDQNGLLIIYIPILVILVIIISTLSRLFIVYKTNNFIEEIRYDISSRLMDNYINNEYNYKNKSEIAKSILSEVDQFIIIVFQPTILMITNIFLLIGIIFYLVFANTTASLISLIFILIFYSGFHFFTKNILNIEGLKSEKANKGRFKVAIESFESIKDIKIYNAEIFFKERFKAFSKSFAKTNALYNTLVASPKYLLEMIVFIALSTSILIITLRDIIDINSLPIIGTFAFAAYKAQPALSNIIYGINSLEFGSKIIDNLYKKLKNRKSDKLLLISRKEKVNFGDKTYSILIKNLTYKFNQREGIENVNLQIKNQSLLVLLGESGSGKSTLLNLIAGLLKPQKGSIRFNKKIFSNSKPIIAFLHQDYALYDASIAENVAFGISKEKINIEYLNKALKEAGIYDYVYKLEKNIYEKIGESGNKLSIGQRQRIALARALYYNPDILLLDEPTSALDKENEKKIMRTIYELAKKITIVMSTHKINYLPKNTLIGLISKNNDIEIKTIDDFKLE